MKRKDADWSPSEELLAHFPDLSGNTVNGLGEREVRRPSRFFWHPADSQPFGDLQRFIVSRFRPKSGEDRSFRNPAIDRGPPAAETASESVTGDAEGFTRSVKAFALEHEADLVGIAPMRPEYVFEGYSIEERWVVIMGFGHRYEMLSRAPASAEDTAAYDDLHDQYNRGARAANHLQNHIASLGHSATSYPGPMASALNMIPAAIQAGLGELGKHGSLINRRFGSAFRLSAVTTDLPLVPDAPDVLNVDAVCTDCQACRKACPPDAILDEKQWVRGEHRWYVDFDKCIPYFGENYACGICIAVCPFSRPGMADRMLATAARRSGQT